MKKEIVKGDNSDITLFSISAYQDISDVGWIGEFTLREATITGDIIIQDFLGKSVDNKSFVYQLTPEQTASLDIGVYFLTIELRNLSLASPLRREVIQQKVSIIQSGVPNV